MAARLARGEVAWDYSRGWDHSIGEIFAEDYAVTNGAGSSGIRWLGDPPPAISDAIRADLLEPPAPPAAPPGPEAPQPAPPPVVTTPAAAKPATTIARGSGRLAAGRRARIGFAVRSTRKLSVRVSGATAGRLRAVLRCGARARGGATARRGRPATVRARVGPSRCRVTLQALGAASRYRVVVRGA